jgi:hypothetical protein
MAVDHLVSGGGNGPMDRWLCCILVLCLALRLLRRNLWVVGRAGHTSFLVLGQRSHRPGGRRDRRRVGACRWPGDSSDARRSAVMSQHGDARGSSIGAFIEEHVLSRLCDGASGPRPMPGSWPRLATQFAMPVTTAYIWLIPPMSFNLAVGSWAALGAFWLLCIAGLLRALVLSLCESGKDRISSRMKWRTGCAPPLASCAPFLAKPFGCSDPGGEMRRRLRPEFWHWAGPRNS